METTTTIIHELGLDEVLTTFVMVCFFYSGLSTPDMMMGVGGPS